MSDETSLSGGEVSGVENPPVFPVADIRDENGCGYMEGSPGISLRDLFASQALPSVITAMQESHIANHPIAGGGPAGFAATSYDIADAMLAARAKATDA